MTPGPPSERTAIITGASRGIGATITLSSAKEGARLAVAARTSSDIERVVDACREAGAGCSIRVVDVTERNQVQ